MATDKVYHDIAGGGNTAPKTRKAVKSATENAIPFGDDGDFSDF